MLEFERTVKAVDKDAAVCVFVDAEKGHTIYLSHTGMLSVVETEKGKNTKVRTAGFSFGSNDCSDCNGC